MAGVPAAAAAVEQLAPAPVPAQRPATRRLGMYPPEVNFLKDLVYGGTAGVVGAATMFPVDTAKTRVQNEKVAAGARRAYTSIYGALKTIARTEGVRGLYNGLQIQALGIIPEKALKLSVNDSMRYRLRSADGSITFFNETVAGAAAGFSQVLVTSPMEMLKIRLQNEATKPRAQQRPASAIVREVVAGGVGSVYRGTAATLLRDVPFSVLYFPIFSNLKLFVARHDSTGVFRYLHRPGTSPDELNVNHRVGALGTFVTGTVAGMVAGYAVTPADVIKTRLQSQGGKELWVNIPTCARLTYQREGAAAFFKGAPARMVLIGALFGIVVVTYETLPRYIPL